jgi:hypothetical protein
MGGQARKRPKPEAAKTGAAPKEAKERSPRRKPWVNDAHEEKSPGGAKENSPLRLQELRVPFHKKGSRCPASHQLP